MKRSFTLAVLGILFGIVSSLPALAAETPIPPAPTRWVTDDAGFLSAGTRATLDARLAAYQQRTGHQVIVWIGRTTGGAPFEEWCTRAFQSWRVGRQGLDDGAALFLLVNDHRVRIEVGYGLEPVLTDAQTSRIIRDQIVPKLAADDHDGAVLGGVSALLGTAGGEVLGGPAAHVVPARPPQRMSIAKIFLAAILGLGFLILLIRNPTLAWFLLMNVLSGGRRGGGDSGGGGGGFSGGGGRSGGGGSSGSW